MSTEADTAEILRRLVAREGVPGGIPAMTPLRALRVAVKKAGQAIAAAGLRLNALEERPVSLAEFGQALDARSALFRLNNSPEAIGLFAVDAPVIHGIAAVRTTGTLPRDGLPERKVTRVDCVVALPVLAAILNNFVAALDGLEAERLLTGYRIGAFLADRTAALLELEDVPYRLFAGEVAVGDGAGTGKIAFVVPAAPLRRVAPGAHDAEWQRRVAAGVMQAETVLEARLPVMALELTRLRNLAVGTDLPLSAEALTQVLLVTSEGKPIASGRLGQLSGNRAVRLTGVRR